MGLKTYLLGEPVPQTVQKAAQNPLQRNVIQRFFNILRIAGPLPAVILLLLAAAQTYSTSFVGQVAGQFYQSFIDQDADKFIELILRSCLLYAASAVLIATSDFFTSYLALRWRISLTSKLQTLYIRCCI